MEPSDWASVLGRMRESLELGEMAQLYRNAVSGYLEAFRGKWSELSESRYTDPVTGETYAEQWERDLWDLNRIEMEERRKLIYYARSEWARTEAEQRRRAG